MGKFNGMEPNTTTSPDGYLLNCKMCGNDHEVPEEKAPYWDRQMLRNILVGYTELGCPEKPGTARYSFTDFKPYRLAT
jgi:hypothetical protein